MGRLLGTPASSQAHSPTHSLPGSLLLTARMMKLTP